MAPARRRTRTGLPVAVLIAILTAIFGGRLSRQRAPATVPQEVAPAPSATAPSASAAPRDPKVAAPTRSRSPGFTTRAHLEEHFAKHGDEFPGLTIDSYLLAAQTLRDQPAGGDVLELRRSDGVVTRFDKASGAFLAVNRDRTIRTFFRPNDGEAYFRRQATRTHGGGP
jgi:hypothetical protein